MIQPKPSTHPRKNKMCRTPHKKSPPPVSRPFSPLTRKRNERSQHHIIDRVTLTQRLQPSLSHVHTDVVPPTRKTGQSLSIITIIGESLLRRPHHTPIRSCIHIERRRRTSTPTGARIFPKTTPAPTRNIYSKIPGNNIHYFSTTT